MNYTNKELAEKIEEKMNYDSLRTFYDVENADKDKEERTDWNTTHKLSIEDFLDQYYINKSLNGLRDGVHEYADGEVNIYYHSLSLRAQYLTDYINDAISEGLVNMDYNTTIDKLQQAGEYLFYIDFYNEVCDKLEEIINEEQGN